jgi:hypothetical protein
MSEPTYRVEPAEVSVKGWAVKHADGRCAAFCATKEDAERIAALLTQDDEAYKNVWLLEQWNEARTDTRVRGVYRSRDIAEAEMASVMVDHPDLKREDFIFACHNIREAAYRAAQEQG